MVDYYTVEKYEPGEISKATNGLMHILVISEGDHIEKYMVIISGECHTNPNKEGKSASKTLKKKAVLCKEDLRRKVASVNVVAGAKVEGND